MRVVVTGAAGFLGSHLCEELIARGDEVVGVDCFTSYYDVDQKRANLTELHDEPRFTFHDADLRIDALEPIIDGAHVVVNEAATPGLVLSWDDFDQYLSCNVSAVKRLADAAVAVGGPHIVHASTSSVYGAEATGDERADTLPVSPYGVTKLAAEHLLRAYRETFDLPVTVLRYFSIYGPRQRPDMAYRIFTERLRRGEPVTVYGDGRQSRSNTYVGDAVSATCAAVKGGAVGETLNIGGGSEVELLEAIEIIAAHLGVEARIDFEPARRGDQRRTVADTRRARRVLGWEPRVDPHEGLRRQVEWAVDARASGSG